VRVIGNDGNNRAFYPLAMRSILRARTHGVGPVEVAPNATPPVCRLVDYGKYATSNQEGQEARKHQHANQGQGDPAQPPRSTRYDFGVKLTTLIVFSLRGDEGENLVRFAPRMAHQEFAFQVVRKFIQEITPTAIRMPNPSCVVRVLNVMISRCPGTSEPRTRASQERRDVSKMRRARMVTRGVRREESSRESSVVRKRSA